LGIKAYPKWNEERVTTNNVVGRGGVEIAEVKEGTLEGRE